MIGVLQCDRYYRYAGPPHEVEGLKNCRAALLDTQTHVAFIIIPPRSAVELIYNMPSSHCPESWWWIYQKRNWRWLLFVPWSPFPCYYWQPCQSARWFGCEHAQEISGLSCAISGPKSIKCIDSIRRVHLELGYLFTRRFSRQPALPVDYSSHCGCLGIEEGLLLASQIWLLEVLQTDWSQGHNEKRCQNSKWESIKTKPQSGNYFGGFLKDLLFQWFTTINALWSNTNCHLDSSKQHKIPR